MRAQMHDPTPTFLIIGMCTALLMFSGVASAQIPKKPDQKCINNINKGALKVAKAQAGDNNACVKDYGKGKVPSADACVTSDPKGKVGRAISKIKTGDCDGVPPALPGLDINSASIGATMVAKDLDLLHDLFGPDPISDPNDGVLVLAANDKDGSKCQAAVIKAAGKCQDAKLKEFNSCKKNGMKNGSITDANSLRDNCLGTGAGTQPDPKGKIAKKCGGDFDLAKKCSVANVDALIPGCAPGVAAACIDQKIECRLCLALNAVDGLDRNCDEFDDGVVNGSCAHDRVIFTNPSPTGEIGILLDGTVDGSSENDKKYITAADGHVDPGDVTAGARNEVIAWQERRPVALKENAGWMAGNEDVTVPFANHMGIAFEVWLVKGPAADREAQAITASVKLAQIWLDERMGSFISAFSINDATGDADAADFHDFTCGKAADIKTDIGFNANRLNIYYVDTVDFGTGPGTGNGIWCGGSRLVAMGSTTSDHLFAHEVGHGFELSHVNDLMTDFDRTNVMHNASNVREFLTEGQTYRAHLEPDSAINVEYALRPGLPTRDCVNLNLLRSPSCPEVQRRIWDDGANFPAN